MARLAIPMELVTTRKRPLLAASRSRRLWGGFHSASQPEDYHQTVALQAANESWAVLVNAHCETLIWPGKPLGNSVVGMAPTWTDWAGN